MKRRNFLKTSFIGTAGLSSYSLFALEPRLSRFANGKYCVQPGADIPVIADTDVFVAGGTLGGVTAAVAAAKAGARVFLAGYLPYLGEDICGSYKNLFENKIPGENELWEKLFSGKNPVSPMHIKTQLEKELIDHNVKFLYCSFITDVIFDENNQPAGVIINNRTGRQAILSKTIIDCTPGAYVARLAGAGIHNSQSSGEMTIQFISAGNKGEPKQGIKLTKLPLPLMAGKKQFPVFEYQMSLPVKEFSFSGLAEAEQIFRDRTWDNDQVDSADHLFWNAPYHIKCKGLSKKGNIEDIPVQSFMPEGKDYLFVLNSCAGIDQQSTTLFHKPDKQIKLGNKLGRHSANLAVERKSAAKYHTSPVKGFEYLNGVTGEISEFLRPNLGHQKIWSAETAIPVLGEYDVVVAGGGTAGAPAAIGAARSGAKTLVIEYLHGFGGTGTLGLIGRYWYGHRDGFTKEIDEGVRNLAGADHPRQRTRIEDWVIDWKMEWYRREIRKAGGDIWFGVLATGAFVHQGRVKGVLVATPEGRGVILAKQVIDSTGSADIAIAAGAGYEYTGEETVAVQGAGLPKKDPDDHYNNTDWTFIDDSDIFDVTRVFISGKQKFPSAYDVGKLPQTRERRRVKAEFMVSPVDMLLGRRYPDTISYHKSNFDTHGYTTHPYFIIKQPVGGHVTYDVDLPLRCLLPKDLDGIMVTGLGTGAHRDAMPVIRMQPCLQNQGYAVGCLAAQLVRENISARKVNLRKLQQQLVDMGNLPSRILEDSGNLTLPDSAFEEAITKLHNDFDGLLVLFSDIKKGMTYLEKALQNPGSNGNKLNAAIALGVLGVNSGWKILAEEVASREIWDEGWNYTGMGQFGFSLSRLDTIIIALGRCREKEALPLIITKAGLLTIDHHFSHFRAVSVAFESIGSKEAAPVIFNLLKMEGISGHHVVTYPDAVRATVPSHVDVSLRNNTLRELHLARALYRCGDHYGLGKQILENYANDLHGHYFRHASGVLGYVDF